MRVAAEEKSDAFRGRPSLASGVLFNGAIPDPGRVDQGLAVLGWR